MRYHRKVIRITAEDSPNVKLALRQQALGLPITNEIIVPGVLTWEEYQQRRRTWDAIRQTVGLDAQFYVGAEVRLYPPDRLKAALALWHERQREGDTRKSAIGSRRYMGVDPAEGGDRSAWAIMDRYGLLRIISIKTPNTNVVVTKTLELMQAYGIAPEDVLFDRGGGGKQHHDRLTGMGVPVRAISFAEGMVLPPKRSMRQHAEKIEVFEDKTLYKTRRVQMFWEGAELFDKVLYPEGFALSPEAFNAPEEGRLSLAGQLGVIPKEYDKDGRPYLRPKDRDPGREESDHKTLKELIGHSPDESDAFVLGAHAMTQRVFRAEAGAA